MKILNKLIVLGLSSVFLPQVAQAKQSVCVFDLLGKAGESYKLMEEWALAAKTWGGDIQLIPYQNETRADQDFKANKCDAVAMTTMRLCALANTTSLVVQLMPWGV